VKPEMYFNSPFIDIGNAYETIKDPLKRKVYDKFGEIAFSCKACKTYREYLWDYLTSFAGFYISSGATVLLN
jgi:DnaJ-class molecular chaperone